MNDQKCLELLRLIKEYADTYKIDDGMTVADLVDDLAMSMDVTSDEADHIRQQFGN